MGGTEYGSWQLFAPEHPSIPTHAMLDTEEDATFWAYVFDLYVGGSALGSISGAQKFSQVEYCVFIIDTVSITNVALVTVFVEFPNSSTFCQ